MKLRNINVLLLCCVLPSCSTPPRETSSPGQSTSSAPADPLRSWNEGAAKRSIVEFVARTTTQGGADFVPPAERIAVFDNDGTLWSEQPMYVQLAFALD